MPTRRPAHSGGATAATDVHTATVADTHTETDSDAHTAAVRAYYRTIAPYYDLELHARGDAAFWREVGRAYRARRILELGCGSGRVTDLLAEAGAVVTGIDLSPEMLARARDRLARWPNARCRLADMRHLALGAQFDAVVAADDPFSHLIEDADRDAALQTVAAHLAPAGRFYLDALWFPATELARAASAKGRRRERRIVAHGRRLIVREHWRCDPRTLRCQARYEYRLDGDEPVAAAFEGRAWTPTELRERLARAGLQAQTWWGGYDGAPWAQAASGHLIVVATLAASEAAGG